MFVEFFEATPFACRMPADQTETPWPAGDTLAEALTRVALKFSRDPHTGTAHLMTGTVDAGVSDSVLLLRIDPGTLLVIGLTPLADQARTLLADGVLPSWRPHELPATRTSVSTLKSALTTQMYNILLTHQFATVEEVATVPTPSWAEFHHVGDKFVVALKRALADAAPPAPAKPVPAGGNGSVLPPPEEARRVAAQFDLPRTRRDPFVTAGAPDSRWGIAKVCQLEPDRVLHVIGASEMAEQLRDEYRSQGVVGWRLAPMADTRTPLHEALLTAQDAASKELATAYNTLHRTGFIYGEEVAACSDEVLRQVRNIGPRVLDALRGVLGAKPDRTPSPAPAVSTDAAARFLAENLTPAAATRYRDLVSGLAVSTIPDIALGKIVSALNAEPLPPADLMVTLLLDTAGKAELLELYALTHDHPVPE
jgi:hypothetical protein